MDAKSVQDFAKVVSSLFQMEKDSRLLVVSGHWYGPTYQKEVPMYLSPVYIKDTGEARIPLR